MSWLTKLFRKRKCGLCCIGGKGDTCAECGELITELFLKGASNEDITLMYWFARMSGKDGTDVHTYIRLKWFPICDALVAAR